MSAGIHFVVTYMFLAQPEGFELHTSIVRLWESWGLAMRFFSEYNFSSMPVIQWGRGSSEAIMARMRFLAVTDAVNETVNETTDTKN